MPDNNALQQLTIVHYCHPNCEPFHNIMRLSKEDAFALAMKLAEANPNTTAFYRFADFVNYYPLRVKTDQALYKRFCELGGKPKESHPLSFVLQGCDYLNQWFDNGKVFTFPLNQFESTDISFTLGDSGASLERTGDFQMLSLDQLLQMVSEFETVADFMKHIEETCHYIEVQLWNNKYIL